MVSAEFAAALPVVVLLLAVLLTAMAAGVDQLRVTDAARVTARAAARGDPVPQASAAGRRDAPAGASVDVALAADAVTVTVRAPVRGPVRWVLGGWRPQAVVQLPRERSPEQAP